MNYDLNILCSLYAYRGNTIRIVIALHKLVLSFKKTQNIKC